MLPALNNNPESADASRKRKRSRWMNAPPDGTIVSQDFSEIVMRRVRRWEQCEIKGNKLNINEGSGVIGEVIAKIDGLNQSEVEMRIVRARLRALNRHVTYLHEYDGAVARAPSPEPVYDSLGKRSNTREKRLREAIKKEQQVLIEKVLTLKQIISGADGTSISLKRGKQEIRIPIPMNKYPDYNFKGILIGPRGMNQKRLENETGCRIAVRGKGMRKRKDGITMPGDELPLHVLVEAWDPEKFEKGVAAIKKLLIPVTEKEQRKQLKELAVLNGTYRPKENLICHHCGATGHRLYQCPKRTVSWKPANVKCINCGESSHITQDCPQPMGLMSQKPGLDSEYNNFMKEISGENEASVKNLGSNKIATPINVSGSHMIGNIPSNPSLQPQYHQPGMIPIGFRPDMMAIPIFHPPSVPSIPAGFTFRPCVPSLVPPPFSKLQSQLSPQLGVHSVGTPQQIPVLGSVRSQPVIDTLNLPKSHGGNLPPWTARPS